MLYFLLRIRNISLTNICHLMNVKDLGFQDVELQNDIERTTGCVLVCVCLSVCLMQLGPALLIRELGSGHLHRVALQFTAVHSQGHYLLVSGVPPDHRGWRWFP